MAMEVKLASVDTLAAWLTSQEVAELVGVSNSTILKWRMAFDEGGVVEDRDTESISLIPRDEIREVIGRRKEAGLDKLLEQL